MLDFLLKAVVALAFLCFAVWLAERYGLIQPDYVRQQALTGRPALPAGTIVCNPRDLGSAAGGREHWGANGIRYSMDPRPTPTTCLVVNGNYAYWQE